MRFFTVEAQKNEVGASGSLYYETHDLVLLLLVFLSLLLAFYSSWQHTKVKTNDNHFLAGPKFSATRGNLFRYGNSPAQIAFQTGKFKRMVVLVSGLDCGMLSMPYCQTLTEALKSHNWSLVEPLFSSSFQGYGTGSLTRDAREFKELFTYLKNERGCRQVVFMGFSTGAQDALRFMKLYQNAKDIPEIKGVILQAPVSDQEYRETFPDTAKRISAALEMVSEGKAEEILFREYSYHGTPMCARRFLSLAKRYGDDDMFSSYFTKEDFTRLLGHMNSVPCLVIFSGNDEFVPAHVNKEQLCQSFVEAMGSKSRYYIVAGGHHYLEGKEKELNRVVLDFLSEIE